MNTESCEKELDKTILENMEYEKCTIHNNSCFISIYTNIKIHMRLEMLHSNTFASNYLLYIYKHLEDGEYILEVNSDFPHEYPYKVNKIH